MVANYDIIRQNITIIAIITCTDGADFLSYSILAAYAWQLEDAVSSVISTKHGKYTPASALERVHVLDYPPRATSTRYEFGQPQITQNIMSGTD